MSAPTPASNEGDLERLFAAIPERNTSDCLLRTMQQHHVQLSVMADTKANIIITISSIVLTLALGRLGDPLLRHASLTLAGFTLLALLLAFRWPVLQRGATRMIWTMRRRGGQLRKLAAVLRRFVRTWRSYADDARLVAIMIVLAVAFQLTNVAIVAAIAGSLDIVLAFADAAWITGAVTIVTLVPIAIGGVGLREAGFVGFLGMVGVPAAQALSVSLVCTIIVVAGAAAGLLVELRWTRRAALVSRGK
jgi:uncharacterized membrane protein YbhN (UPF0104 family)